MNPTCGRWIGAMFCVLLSFGLHAQSSGAPAGNPPAPALMANGFEGLGLALIQDRAVFVGESLAVQAQAFGVGLTYSLPQAPAGASINPQSGLIAWTPTVAQTGTAPFTVRVTSPSHAFDQRSFQVAVLSSNRRPRIAVVEPQRLRVGATLSLALVATDPDVGDTLSFARLAGPAAMTVTPTGAVSWTPSTSDVGQVLVRVGVADSAGESDVTSFEVRVDRGNQAPAFAPLPNRVATVGRLLTLAVAALDPDVGDSLSYALELAPAGITLNPASGVLRFTPTVAQIGRHRVRVVATDSLGDTGTGAFDIDVISNVAPVALDDNYSVTQGTTLTVSAPGVLGNDTDANQDALSSTLVNGTAGGTLNLQPTGAFTYTPAPASVAAKRIEGTQVISIDFENGVPTPVAPGQSTVTGVQGYAGLGTPGNQFTGSFLRGGANVPVTLTLVNLPAHTALDLDFLLAIIDSWDGSGTFPAGDSFEVTLDGQRLFRESFANAIASQVQTYVPPAGVQLARMVPLGFTVGGFHADSAYDLGADPVFSSIPHTASTATITFKMAADTDQGISDESWAIDNVRVAISTPSDQIRTENFTYRANDAEASSAAATVSIAVRPAVFAPRILSQPALDAAAGLPYRYDVIVLSSQPAEMVTFELIQAPAGATISPAGVVAWTPTTGQVGTNRFEVRVTDPRAASGSQVFVVSVTAPVSVPGVVGQTQLAAGNALTAANLVTGAITQVASPTVAAGLVVSQLPAAGTSVPRSTRVALEISSGPPPIPVPNMVGRTRADAESNITGSGFVIGAVSFGSHPSLSPGTVLSQSPAAATYAAAGTSVSLVVVSGPPLRLALPRSVIDAGQSSTLGAVAYDENGVPSATQPALTFTVSAVQGLSGGAPAIVSGNVLNTSASTRGRYRVRVTRNDTLAFDEAFVTVVAPRPATPQFAAHQRFERLLAELAEPYRQLRIAALANDAATLAALRTDFAARASALRADLELLRLAPITAPERGFFPAPAALPAAGFPETADDRTWSSTLASANTQLLASITALDALGAGSGDASLAALRALDEQLRLRTLRLSTLSPTPFSAVVANGQVSLLLASRAPRMVLAELESFVRMLTPSEQPQFAGALAGAAISGGLRNHLVDKLYGDALDHVRNSAAVLAFAALLRQFVGPTDGMDVLTGASLSVHLFRLPGSSLDGSFNPIAEMNDVLMIGPDAAQVVFDLLDTLNLEDTGSAQELMEKFQGIADAADAVVAAYEEANSTPDRASAGCLLTDSDCVSISWDDGFTSVNEGGNLRLPGPVIILVRDIADGRVHLVVTGFLGQPDPDED